MADLDQKFIELQGFVRDCNERYRRRQRIKRTIKLYGLPVTALVVTLAWTAYYLSQFF